MVPVPLNQEYRGFKMRLLTFICTIMLLFCASQDSYAQWTAQGKVRWDMLEREVHDSIRTTVSDSMQSFVADSARDVFGDSLAYYFATDTITMKAFALAEGRTIYLNELAEDSLYGGGTFVAYDSTNFATKYNTAVPDGGVIFDHSTTDVIYVRQDFLTQNYIDPVWYGAKPDSTEDTQTTAAFVQAVEQAYAFRQGHQNIPIIIPHGVFLIEDLIELRPNSYVKGQGMSTKIFQNSDTPGNDPHFGEWQTTLLDNIDYNNYYLGYMYLESNHPYNTIDTKRTGTAGLGGLYLSGDKNPMNRVVVEHLTVRGSGLGIQLKLAREVHVSHCHVEYTDWVAYTLVGTNLTMLHNSADSVSQFLELVGENETTNGGTVTTTGNGTTLYDGGQDWTADEWIAAGHRITNNTDGSEATVVSVTNDSTLVTTALSGGSDNTWQASDTYTHYQRYGNVDSTCVVNISKNYGISIKDYGAWIKNYTSLVFEGNQLYGVKPTSGDQFGVQVTTSQKINTGSGYGNKKEDCYGVVQGNYLENFTVGIQIKGSSTAEFQDSLFHHVNILGNTINRMWTNGILIEMDHASFTEYGRANVANNVVKDFNFSSGSTSGSAYYLSRVNNVNLHNNQSYSTQDFKFPGTISTSGGGTAKTDTIYDGSATFTDWPEALFANRAITITNVTDGSSADSIIAVINDTTLVTDELQGGSDQTWQSGDTYRFGADAGTPLAVTSGAGNNHIHNNDFTNPTFATPYIYDGGTANANNNYYGNNEGLTNIDRALLYNGTYGYQHAWEDSNGTWMGGGGKADRAVLWVWIEDTLCTVLHNQTGAVVDTVRERPARP